MPISLSWGSWSSHWATGAGYSWKESCWTETMGWRCSEKPELEGKNLWAGKVCVEGKKAKGVARFVATVGINMADGIPG